MDMPKQLVRRSKVGQKELSYECEATRMEHFNIKLEISITLSNLLYISKGMESKNVYLYEKTFPW